MIVCGNLIVFSENSFGAHFFDTTKGFIENQLTGCVGLNSWYVKA